MSTSDIQQLLFEKETPCISILIPTYRYANDRKQNPTVILKAIHKAKELLTYSQSNQEIKELLRSKLESVEKQLDYIRLQEALGIFVSQNISRILLFPIPVKEKIVFSNRFALHDLYYLSQLLRPYYLLALSKKRVPLFRCEGRHLQEIRNGDFPKQYSEEYEYAYPSLGSSIGPGIKNVEGEKSIVAEGRQIDFIRQVDHGIEKYLKNNTPLLIAGVDEELANFNHTTRHSKNVIGMIRGNYSVDALHMLSDLAWTKVNEHILKSHNELLNKFKEDIGKNLATDGIRDVWAMAMLGKGLTLLVEKDFHSQGYIDPSNEVKLYLNPPAARHQIIYDAVEEIIAVVARKKGNVVVMENGALETYGRIGLLLRYS